MNSKLVGTAYGKRPGQYRKELTEVGAGTPMGELMRRYWHPIALSTDADAVPREIRMLGEDLVLFRDGQGLPGLVHSRCAHRGTSLFYGRVEERGIRCCYHGWLFDVEGNCLEQPCEANMGAKYRDRARQPWYPVQERYGLIFAYLGPPDKMPVLPRYECLENLAEDEFVATDDTSIGTEGDVIMPCNWLQHFENLADPFHVPMLHFRGAAQQPQDAIFKLTERGGVEASPRYREGAGYPIFFSSEAIVPTLRIVWAPWSSPFSIAWIMPIDDTHLRIYTVTRQRRNAPQFIMPPELVDVFNSPDVWREMTTAERRQRPGDWEAQTGQGPINLHSEEHLVSSDRGVIMARKLLLAQLKAIDQGLDPINVSFDPNTPPVRWDKGDWPAPKFGAPAASEEPMSAGAQAYPE